MARDAALASVSSFASADVEEMRIPVLEGCDSLSDIETLHVSLDPLSLPPLVSSILRGAEPEITMLWLADSS